MQTLRLTSLGAQVGEGAAVTTLTSQVAMSALEDDGSMRAGQGPGVRVESRHLRLSFFQHILIL